MNRNIRSIALMAALAVILVIGVVAQQKAADTAVDPVCGMTVVKANAKATFDFKGTTYYFCSTGCKEAFAKEPEKYLKAKTEAKEAAGMPMGQKGEMGMMKHEGMAGCPMMGGGKMMGGQMGHMGMPKRPMMGAGFAPLFMLYGDKIEVTVENTKDGAVLKVASKDPEVVKAIQVHLAEHLAMMKKMKEADAKAPMAPGKMSESACCADCATIKK
jgi:YHS domain-containing protein